MRMYDIILKKRLGQRLEDEEIRFFVEGYTSGEIPDYQASALLMAVCFQGMDTRETAVLTDCMAHSGDMADLSMIPGIKVDKHSTGGVGDKTSLVVGPIAAACGIRIAKMSGRGLGHTGGTLDKLEAIPGLSTTIGKERFLEIVRQVGLSIIGQTGDIAPADKKLYALRDVTATVDSLPLIASSIMSKKLAAGADAILLDVKTGSGAFMKTLEDSIALAKSMVDIGEHMGKHTIALVTDMDRPLGRAVGNSLEVIEAVETLHGRGPQDFTRLCLELGANMLVLGGMGTLEECRARAQEALESGRAFEKLCAMVAAQGGDERYLRDPERFAKAPFMEPVLAPQDGYIAHMQTQQVGIASVILGAGRANKEDAVDPLAGLILCKKAGEPVKKGETVARLYTSEESTIEQARSLLLDAMSFTDVRPGEGKLIDARIDRDGVYYYE